MDHPVRAIIKQLNYTSNAFAVLHGIPIETLRYALKGRCNHLPSKVQVALRKLGYDVEQVDLEYQQWLVWKSMRDVDELRETGSQQGGDTPNSEV